MTIKEIKEALSKKNPELLILYEMCEHAEPLTDKALMKTALEEMAELLAGDTKINLNDNAEEIIDPEEVDCCDTDEVLDYYPNLSIEEATAFTYVFENTDPEDERIDHDLCYLLHKLNEAKR